MQGLGTSIKAKVIAAHMNKNAFLQVAPKAKQAMRFPLEIKLISRQPYFIVQCHNKILTDNQMSETDNNVVIEGMNKMRSS